MALQYWRASGQTIPTGAWTAQTGAQRLASTMSNLRSIANVCIILHHVTYCECALIAGCGALRSRSECADGQPGRFVPDPDGLPDPTDAGRVRIS